MLNERLEVALPIAKSLKRAEDSLNESVQSMATLVVDVTKARASKGTRFQLSAGLAACECTAQALVFAVQGYRQMIEAHGHLAIDQENANLATVSFGDTYCPPKENGMAASTQTALRVVGE